MRKQTFGKKLLALSLSVTMLLSCMVWSGVSAAATTYTCDFTGYTKNSTQHWHDVSGYTDSHESDSAKAQVISTEDATHGQVMQLAYTDNAPKDDEAGLLGFRFFAGTGANDSDKVAVNAGVCVKVEFSYKVQKLMAPAELRVLAGSASWYTPIINSGEAAGANHWATAAALDATGTPGEWQKAAVIIYGERGSSGVHIYMRTDSPTAQGGSSVLIDDVSVTTEYVPSTVTFNCGYDNRVETVVGIDGAPVTFPELPSRTAWTFKGWNDKQDGTGNWIDTTAVTFNGSVTYYAIWEVDPNASVITLDTNGGDAITDLVGALGEAATLPTPTRGVYTFLGWYTDPELTTPAADVTFPATAGASFTLYAKWQAPAALESTTKPGGKTLGSQTFESNAMGDFVVKPGIYDGISDEQNYTAEGSKALKATILRDMNQQRYRPRLVLKMDGASDNLKVEAGKSYTVSFWVRSARRNSSFTFWLATMGKSDLSTAINATSGACHTLQNIGFNNLGTLNGAGNEVTGITLEADQWTQIVVNIPGAVLDSADEDNYLALGYTFNDSGKSDWQSCVVYVDDISVYEVYTVNFDTDGGDPLDPVACIDDGKAVLPEPYKFGYTYTGWYTDPACTEASKVTSPYAPQSDNVTLYTKWQKSSPTVVEATQDFENATSIDAFSYNTGRPFVLATDTSAGTGTKALKASIEHAWNGNFRRPLWAFQMAGQDAPMQVSPGMSATVTFKVMASKDIPYIYYRLDTVNDPSALSTNPGSSAEANAYRTTQALSSDSTGYSATGEPWLQLKAGEWTTITATIPAIVAHGSGAQYLVLGITDGTSGAVNYAGVDLYVDDITIATQTGGHAAKVVHNTNGGDAMEDGIGVIWGDVLTEATREGYDFDGWYAEESCVTPVTTYDLASSSYDAASKTFTLYAGWRPKGADVMTFEVSDSYVPKVYADMDLSDSSVQTYYTENANNWYTAVEAKHELVSDSGKTVMKITYGKGANANNKLLGFRIVGKESTGAGYKVTQDEAFRVSFMYKVEKMPVDTEIRLLEGSIPWGTALANYSTDHRGFTVTAADAGAGWQQGTIDFMGTLGDAIHMVLEASDLTKREGTVIYLSDLRVESVQLSKFTTSAGAQHVEDEQNHTKGGNTAVKVDTSTTGRVVYARGLYEKPFAVDTINTVTAWLYAAEDIEATLKVYNDPDPTKMTGADVMGEKTVSLKGGVWTRVQYDFGLTAVGEEESTYVSVGVSSATGSPVYMDDVSVGVYPNDPTKTQTYEEFPVGTSANTDRLDGTLHGLNGNTVVSGIGYDGSAQSLQITMKSAKPEEASRAVLMLDKMDATATVEGGYIATFYAMVEKDLEVTFGLGTSATINVSQPSLYATVAEADASKTVALKAGEWTPVSLYISDLQGRNPEKIVNPYVTLAAWFEGVSADNAEAVYIDNVTFRDYYAPIAIKENVLCFEDTEAFDFGKQLNLSTSGEMQVLLEQNHSNAGYFSLKVTSTAAARAARPQFNLMNAYGDAIKVEKDESYRISYWVYLPEDAPANTLNWWVTITDSTQAYTEDAQVSDELVYESNGATATKGGWKQLSAVIDATRSGYLRLGICGAEAAETVFYLDDIRATAYMSFELTGDETVMDFETYNLDDKDFIRHGEGFVSDEQNHTDKGLNSLRLVGVSNMGYHRNQMILIDPATHEPYEFVPGDNYTLSFWMYCPSSSIASVRLNAWLWGTDDPSEEFASADEKNSKNGSYEWDGDLTPVTNDENYIPDEWNRYEITFTAQNGKYMLMGMTNLATNDGGYVYYLDDIEITKPTPAVIVYDSNGGAFDESDKDFLNDKGQYVERTAVGMYAQGPGIDPYLAGKQLLGWALDVEGQQFFDIQNTPISQTEMTLYAIWGDWETGGEDYDKIDKTDKDEEEIKYRTEIHSEKVWTGNAVIPVLDADDDFYPEDADPVTYVPPTDDEPAPVADGLPVWLIIVLIVAAVIVVGGGSALALLLLKQKKSTDDKEDA